MTDSDTLLSLWNKINLHKVKLQRFYDMACSLDCKKGKRKHSDHGLFMPKIPDRNDNGLETENSFGTMACCYQFFHKYIANKSLV